MHTRPFPGYRWALSLALLAGVVTAAVLPTRAEEPAPFSCRVLRVVDGDTVVVSVDGAEERVRLAEIDAPEVDQPGGREATEAAVGLLLDREVVVTETDRDRYGRLVGSVSVDGRDAGRALVRLGHAWAYRKYLVDRSLLGVEALARESGTGLWASAGPIAPWAWRRGSRTAGPDTRSSRRSPGCSEPRRCRDFSTCEDAMLHLEACGPKGIDGDRDGIPCEAICGRR